MWFARLFLIFKGKQLNMVAYAQCNTIEATKFSFRNNHNKVAKSKAKQNRNSIEKNIWKTILGNHGGTIAENSGNHRITVGEHWEIFGGPSGNHGRIIAKQLRNHWKNIGNHWGPIGKSLENHWKAIGEILGNHGEPLGNHGETTGKLWGTHSETN